MNNSTPLVTFSENYRANVRTTKGVDILIRPVFAADLSALKEFLSSLSYKTVYYCFLSPIREFSRELLNRLIQVDYKKNIALAAFHRIDSQEKLVGVTRLFISEDYRSAEISLVVTDPWQGRGIGAELFRRCVEIGNSLKIKRIWGYILPENTQMLDLAKKMNFKVKKEEGEHEFLISLDYDRL